VKQQYTQEKVLVCVNRLYAALKLTSDSSNVAIQRFVSPSRIFTIEPRPLISPTQLPPAHQQTC